MPVGLTTAVAGGLTALGVGEATAGILAPALLGAGGGALFSGITGGDPLKGALTGGLTFGGAGLAGSFASDLGLSSLEAAGLGGAAGGALSAGITGSNPLIGAAEGGATGLLQGGALNQVTGGASTGVGAPPGGASAVGAAPPPSVAGAPIDLTSSYDPGSALQGSALATAPVIGPVPDIVTGAPSTALQAANSLGISVPSTATGVNSVGAATGAAPASALDRAIADPTAGNIVKALGANIGPAVAGGGLLLNMLKPQTLQGQSQLTSIADRLAAQGSQLSSYLANGSLPPGVQTAVSSATNAAKAAIKSKYAALGMSGSTAEIQDLNQVDMNATTQAFNMADQLLQNGIQTTGISADLYTKLLDINQQQNQATGNAIANFAAALSGTPIARAA